jgi:hypothetical protein
MREKLIFLNINIQNNKYVLQSNVEVAGDNCGRNEGAVNIRFSLAFCGQPQTNSDPFDYTGLEIHKMSLSSQTLQVNKS